MTQAASCLAQLIQEINSGAIKVVDLTSPLNEDTPILELPPQFGQTWRFSKEIISRYDDRGPAWFWWNFRTGEHTGTHFDAPAHWITGKDLPNNTVDALPTRMFIGPACVLDLEKECAANADYLVTVDDVTRWEADNGQIPKGSIVCLRSGWAKHMGTPRYTNIDDKGGHTPGWATETSRFLAQDRDVLGVGVETVGTDAACAGGFDPPFSNHNIMHGNGKIGLTSLINLDQLPATGAVIVAPPLRITGGSGSPVRVVALVP
jgi:kynurenine formamidase